MASILRPIYEAFSHLFRRTATVRYPTVVLKPAERFAGRHFLHLDKCIGCFLCAKSCPAKAIEPAELKGRKYPQINYGKCAFCQICIHVCPRQALKMTGEYELASYDKASLIYPPQSLAVRPDVSKGRKMLAMKFYKRRGVGHGFVKVTA